MSYDDGLLLHLFIAYCSCGILYGLFYIVLDLGNDFFVRWNEAIVMGKFLSNTKRDKVWSLR